MAATPDPPTLLTPADTPAGVRMPAEFEAKTALVISAAQMVQFHPQTLVDIVKAVIGHVRVICLVSYRSERDKAAELLLNAGLPGDAVTFFFLPVTSMWVRDYGPLSVVAPDGKAYFLDATYARDEADPKDDAVPGLFGQFMRTAVIQVPLSFEGGDLLSNGRGLCLSTQRVISRNTESRGLDPPHIWQILHQAGGFTDWLPLPSLVGEPTGHLDMFLTLIDTTTAVVGQIDPRSDPDNAARLDWVARTLAHPGDQHTPLTVHRVVMPPHDDGIWRTYTNVVFANGVLLVPAYPDRCPELDEQARETYARLLPKWKVVSVDASSLIVRNGSLHCVTLDLPVINDPTF